MTDFKHMSMDELVEVLAQKTQKFTQLLVDKKFNEEYKVIKESIHQILAEIELRKENPVAGDEPAKPASA